MVAVRDRQEASPHIEGAEARPEQVADDPFRGAVHGRDPDLGAGRLGGVEIDY
jgi:hypothetical protein